MKNIKLVINNDLRKEKEKFFIKRELQCILNLYAKMVSNGTWKDYSFSSGSKETGIMAGIAIGSVVAFEAIFAGPISGASMNPARSIAPAIFGDMSFLWIYIVATILGAILSVFTCKLIQSEDCCKDC